jgi:hypothetical protein
MTFTFVNWPGPFQNHTDGETIQNRIAVVPPINRDGTNCFAITFGWKRIELTRATVGAVAID